MLAGAAKKKRRYVQQQFLKFTMGACKIASP